MSKKNSNYANTILRGTIRDEYNRLQIRQCRPQLHCKHAITQSKIAFDAKTVGDILQRLKYNQSLRDIVRNK